MTFISLARVFTICVLTFLSVNAFSNEKVTLESLQDLKPLPQNFYTKPYSERVKWLTSTLENSDNPTDTYRLNRELAFQHFDSEQGDLVLYVCEKQQPLQLDLDYRLICISSMTHDDQVKFKALIPLQNDAITQDNMAVAAETTSIIAWMQSGSGNIEQAFRSYELALSFAESVNQFVLNDITLNLATLYIVHGDGEYVLKGINIEVETVDRVKAMGKENANLSAYVENTLARIYFNLGIANTFHRINYQQALNWFQQIDPKLSELRQSVLVFSSLANAELGKIEEAKSLLKQSHEVAISTLFNSDYLLCYQEIIQVMLSISNQITNCKQVNENTSLEVQQDLLKRMIESSDEELKLLGLKKLYAVYLAHLKPMLKQNSAKSASRAELNRLEQDSRLKGELIEKEKALTAAEKEKLESQSNLTFAIIAVFLLLLVIVLLQLRQKQKLAEQFERMSLFDSLTGLNNRHYFEANIQRELNFVKRATTGNRYNRLAIYMFDIDHFKSVNDKFGHDVGDAVLIEFSRRINETIRESDMFIRWGGEEFLLVARIFDIEEYHKIAERIRNVINQTEFELGKQLKLNVSCTVGGIIYPLSPKITLDIPWTQLVKLADNALYMGKRQQRNCWVCIDEITEPKSLDLIIQQELLDSIKNKQVTISHSMQKDLAET